MGGSGVSPASEWNKLGQLFYRKRELYQMAWREANLDCSLVAVARFGGPVATVHDDKKLSKLGRGVQTSKPVVRIFSASGRPLSSFTWEEARHQDTRAWMGGKRGEYSNSF
ncbi:hypothetical protein CYMTET_38849 [Cymbomonas tetramitiformis]|uniref:Vps16 N-terminal domain-containing protein n=1 Tax=Cymbomonas tetramitiformis TaxID=36881 RepID=A0AAE0CB82_9CHLO|nr:hypothetical protein CYMTET_38849 [Cymbomonas tetramitiformis]|eukprot:gene3195-4042_t